MKISNFSFSVFLFSFSAKTLNKPKKIKCGNECDSDGCIQQKKKTFSSLNLFKIIKSEK